MEKILEFYEKQIEILKSAIEQIASSNQSELNQEIAKEALTKIQKMETDI